MRELKPCPFCGGEASIFGDESTDTWNVFCGNGLCPAEPGTAICFSEREAIEAWNTRAERTCHNADDRKVFWFICSECGGTRKLAHMVGNYCPYCGAKVVK